MARKENCMYKFKAEGVDNAPSFLRNIDQTIVTVLVGPDERKFHLYKARLAKESPYFDKMFNGGFKEATEREGHLAKVPSTTFAIFANWLYTRVIEIPSSGEADVREDPTIEQESDGPLKQTSPQPEDAAQDQDDSSTRTLGHSRQPSIGPTIAQDMAPIDESYRLADNALADLYVFADTYDIPVLRNDIIDAFVTRVDANNILPSLDLVTRVFCDLPETLALPRYLIDLYSECWGGYHDFANSEFQQYKDELPNAFLIGILQKKSRGPQDLKNTRDCQAHLRCCDYHHHSTHSEKRGCKRVRRLAKTAKELKRDAGEVLDGQQIKKNRGSADD
ncbi:hypothetical protein M501DRAFT_1053824 [Patellaria atrata CBS 101060]|uniref:BTB domain-containing protein n=1 Tax=Patellaria atrata CBS 101060 TaxID=1346257 RepID=A0A9P4VV05_9PEZI|nr:hypothetical protein M501DRAFT_1053824 [Patellaria atrata CBS 101060]